MVNLLKQQISFRSWRACEKKPRPPSADLARMKQTLPSSSLAFNDQNKMDRLTSLLRKTCTETSIERGQQVAIAGAERLDHVLLKLGLITEHDLANAYAEMLGVPLTRSDDYPLSPVLPELLKPIYLRAVKICPLRVESGTLVVAVTDGLDDFAPVAITAATTYRVQVEIALPIDLDAALSRLYPLEKLEIPTLATNNKFTVEDDLSRLRDLANGAPIIRLVDEIVGRAVESRASDVHLEPFEDEVRVRYRYDGVLQHIESHKTGLSSALISRIKIMASLDIAERRLPQDGRIKHAVRGTEIDFRVSTIPSLNGETIVLRILDRSAVELNFVRLGFHQAIIKELTRTLTIPNGMLLVTGPTGSGKSTTLYAALSDLNTIARKVITIEDPIEYQLKGITQTQVRSQIGLTFGYLLRNSLRQDPDVIMVGEIRDRETAEISVQAALTGHLVLSTIHTNSAAATVIRLRDMGIENYLLSSVLRGIVAQRLIRQLCDVCKTDYIAPPELSERLDLEARSGLCEYRLWRSVGCDHCRGTGYKGRRAIAEYMNISPIIQTLISGGSHENEIQAAAIGEGMIPIFQSGLSLALDGKTSIEEVTRSVTDEGGLQRKSNPKYLRSRKVILRRA